MNKEFIKRWISALRSGKYSQGRVYLESSTGEMCCLGVACNLLAEDGILQKRLNLSAYEFFAPDSGMSSMSSLPPAAQKYVGFEDDDRHEASGGPIDHDGYTQLWQLNDMAEMTFDEIADVMERHYL